VFMRHGNFQYLALRVLARPTSHHRRLQSRDDSGSSTD